MQSRIGMNGAKDGRKGQAMLHGQANLTQQFSSMSTHHMHSDNLLFFPGQDQFDKPGSSIISLCTINISPWKGDDTYLLVLHFGFYRSETDTRSFGISKGTPRYDA